MSIAFLFLFLSITSKAEKFREIEKLHLWWKKIIWPPNSQKQLNVMWPVNWKLYQETPCVTRISKTLLFSFRSKLINLCFKCVLYLYFISHNYPWYLANDVSCCNSNNIHACKICFKPTWFEKYTHKPFFSPVFSACLITFLTCFKSKPRATLFNSDTRYL